MEKPKEEIATLRSKLATVEDRIRTLSARNFNTARHADFMVERLSRQKAQNDAAIEALRIEALALAAAIAKAGKTGKVERDASNAE